MWRNSVMRRKSVMWRKSVNLRQSYAIFLFSSLSDNNFCGLAPDFGAFAYLCASTP